MGGLATSEPEAWQCLAQSASPNMHNTPRGPFLGMEHYYRSKVPTEADLMSGGTLIG